MSATVKPFWTRIVNRLRSPRQALIDAQEGLRRKTDQLEESVQAIQWGEATNNLYETFQEKAEGFLTGAGIKEKNLKKDGWQASLSKRDNWVKAFDGELSDLIVALDDNPKTMRVQIGTLSKLIQEIHHKEATPESAAEALKKAEGLATAIVSVAPRYKVDNEPIVKGEKSVLAVFDKMCNLHPGWNTLGLQTFRHREMAHIAAAPEKSVLKNPIINAGGLSVLGTFGAVNAGNQLKNLLTDPKNMAAWGGVGSMTALAVGAACLGVYYSSKLSEQNLTQQQKVKLIKTEAQKIESFKTDIHNRRNKFLGLHFASDGALLGSSIFSAVAMGMSGLAEPLVDKVPDVVLDAYLTRTVTQSVHNVMDSVEETMQKQFGITLSQKDSTNLRAACSAIAAGGTAFAVSGVTESIKTAMIMGYSGLYGAQKAKEMVGNTLDKLQEGPAAFVKHTAKASAVGGLIALGTATTCVATAQRALTPVINTIEPTVQVAKAPVITPTFNYTIEPGGTVYDGVSTLLSAAGKDLSEINQHITSLSLNASQDINQVQPNDSVALQGDTLSVKIDGEIASQTSIDTAESIAVIANGETLTDAVTKLLETETDTLSPATHIIELKDNVIPGIDLDFVQPGDSARLSEIDDQKYLEVIIDETLVASVPLQSVPLQTELENQAHQSSMHSFKDVSLFDNLIEQNMVQDMARA